MSGIGFDKISALLFLHLAGFAAWSGLLLALLLQGAETADRAARLLRPCLIAMPFTLLSGWALALAEQGPPGAWSWAVNAMQSIGLVMAVILLVVWFGALMLLRDAEAARDPEPIAAATRRLTRLIAVDLLLAAIVLAISVAGRYG